MSSSVAARGTSKPGAGSVNALALHGCLPVSEDGARTPPWKIWTTPNAPVDREHRREPLEPGEEAIVEDPELPLPPLPVQGHVRRARLDDAEPTTRPHLEPPQLVVRERAVLGALRVRHRREPDAVLDLHAVRERHRLEEGRAHPRMTLYQRDDARVG